MLKPVAIVGSFDDLRSQDVRLFEEASKLGPVTVLLFADATLRAQTGNDPKFPLTERLYFAKALRFVAEVLSLSEGAAPDALPPMAGFKPSIWVDAEGPRNKSRGQFCRKHGLDYRVVGVSELEGFPAQQPPAAATLRKKVIVTGCYDWLHSGHVRFFEEVSAYGDLYVVVGHDANIRLLKGAGHPLLPQEERRYMAGAVRYVTQALVSSGDGWLDAEPEIQKIKPDIYAVNEDGDRGGKRDYCARMGLEYLVLKRIPAPGLPPRSSTDLRGF